jgi:hypothetical protein
VENPACHENKPRIRTKQVQEIWEVLMAFRMVRETLALASVAGFVWMMCTAVHLVA